MLRRKPSTEAKSVAQGQTLTQHASGQGPDPTSQGKGAECWGSTKRQRKEHKSLQGSVKLGTGKTAGSTAALVHSKNATLSSNTISRL